MKHPTIIRSVSFDIVIETIEAEIAKLNCRLSSLDVLSSKSDFHALQSEIGRKRQLLKDLHMFGEEIGVIDVIPF